MNLKTEKKKYELKMLFNLRYFVKNVVMLFSELWNLYKFWDWKKIKNMFKKLDNFLRNKMNSKCHIFVRGIFSCINNYEVMRWFMLI